MTQRDRLITKIMSLNKPTISLQTAMDIVDAIIDEGVIVPPCKVGDTVWFETYKKNATVCVGVQPHKVDRIDVICVCDIKNLVETNIREWEFGQSVFLTRAEAEKALKEREKPNKCWKCVNEVKCKANGIYKSNCPDYKRDAPDGGYYG